MYKADRNKTHAIVYGLCVLGCFVAQVAVAEPISSDLIKKIAGYQAKLSRWAADPVVVEAVKKSNNAPSKFDNRMWRSLRQTQQQVVLFTGSKAAKRLLGWQNKGGIGKLFVRNSRGELVAGSKKPAIFNISDRPAFKNAMGGKNWRAPSIKPDPTTRQSSVQISAPITDAGRVIGVIHANVIAE